MESRSVSSWLRYLGGELLPGGLASGRLPGGLLRTSHHRGRNLASGLGFRRCFSQNGWRLERATLLLGNLYREREDGKTWKGRLRMREIRDRWWGSDGPGWVWRNTRSVCSLLIGWNVSTRIAESLSDSGTPSLGPTWAPTLRGSIICLSPGALTNLYGKDSFYFWYRRIHSLPGEPVRLAPHANSAPGDVMRWKIDQAVR